MALRRPPTHWLMLLEKAERVQHTPILGEVGAPRTQGLGPNCGARGNHLSKHRLNTVLRPTEGRKNPDNRPLEREEGAPTHSEPGLFGIGERAPQHA